jgi:hypothetical protein
MLRVEYLKMGELMMVLPVGKTCKDCYFFVRCQEIYGHIAEDEVCDWSPSKFIEAAHKEVSSEPNQRTEA